MEKIKRLVVFAILMESGDGIALKSPSYIIEKYESAMNLPYPQQLLDMKNKAKFLKWLKTWKAE